MRVTPLSLNARVLRELQTALAAMARQQDHLAAGRRIIAPSDDPGGAARALVFRGREAAAAQFTRNAAEARDRLSTADQVLGSIVSVVTRARELAVQGANGTNDRLARQAIGREVDQLLEGLVALANERGPHDAYLFAGQETTVAPYAVTRDAAGRITAVTPNPRGVDGVTLAEVSENLTVATSVGGTEVFGAPGEVTYAFDVLIRLRDSLEANLPGVAQVLALTADASATGAPLASAYAGIDAATDLQIAGPLGTAFVPLTAAGDDTVSTTAPATSAIATAAAVNAVSATTGVSAQATAAVFTAGDAASLFDDLALAPGDLVINGQSVVVNLAAGDADANRAAFIAAVNALSGATGVVAAPAAGLGFTLTAADGRNIAIRTAAGTGAGTIAGEIFGFATAPTTDTVFARGGVELTSTGLFTTTELNTPADQITGDGPAMGVAAALDGLTAVIERLVAPRTQIGARLGWLDVLDERLSGQAVSMAASRSRLEDLDIPAAVMEFEQMKAYYEAALASGSQLLRFSLLEFLR